MIKISIILIQYLKSIILISNYYCHRKDFGKKNRAVKALLPDWIFHDER